MSKPELASLAPPGGPRLLLLGDPKQRLRRALVRLTLGDPARKVLGRDFLMGSAHPTFLPYSPLTFGQRHYALYAGGRAWRLGATLDALLAEHDRAALVLVAAEDAPAAATQLKLARLRGVPRALLLVGPGKAAQAEGPAREVLGAAGFGEVTSLAGNLTRAAGCACFAEACTRCAPARALSAALASLTGEPPRSAPYVGSASLFGLEANTFVTRGRGWAELAVGDPLEVLFRDGRRRAVEVAELSEHGALLRTPLDPAQVLGVATPDYARVATRVRVQLLDPEARLPDRSEVWSAGRAWGPYLSPPFASARFELRFDQGFLLDTSGLVLLVETGVGERGVYLARALAE